jgi:nucleotide-binding universal stress UspA family protein
MYNRILVPVDGSDDAVRALMQALVICRLVRPRAAGDAGGASSRQPIPEPASPNPEASVPAALRLLYVLDDALDQSELIDEGNTVLAAAVDLAWEGGVAAEQAMVPAAGRTLAATILADAREARADLIVIGTHGRKGLRRAIVGSVAEGVIRDSPIPVLLPGRP